VIIILDFGSQYTQLIARRVREANVFCEIHPFNYPAEKIRASRPKGIILSGGPSSVYDKKAPKPDPTLFDVGVPILGICYGLQIMVTHFGGKVARAPRREYGPAEISVGAENELFRGLDRTFPVWMSHGDHAEQLPEGFSIIATTPNAPCAAVHHAARNFFAVQFHPEVHHTPNGKDILANFLFRVCGQKPDWTMASFAEEQTRVVREPRGQRKGDFGSLRRSGFVRGGGAVAQSVGQATDLYFREQRPASRRRRGAGSESVRQSPRLHHPHRRLSKDGF
jgi:GMP synthase (glutamine-hydrolysing)